MSIASTSMIPRLNGPPAEPQHQRKSYPCHTWLCDAHPWESSAPCKVPVPFPPQHSHPLGSSPFPSCSFPARRPRYQCRLNFTTRDSRVLCRYSRRGGWYSPLAIIQRGSSKVSPRPYFERKVTDSGHLGSTVTPFFCATYDRRCWTGSHQVYTRTTAGPPYSQPLLRAWAKRIYGSHRSRSCGPCKKRPERYNWILCCRSHDFW